MKTNKWGRWVVVVALAGCSGKLKVGVSPRPGGSAGESQTEGAAGGGNLSPDLTGTLGEPCFAGGSVVEADGTVAKTQVTTLDLCLDGLSCASNGKCVIAPDCPQPTGICVVHRAALATGDSGGVLENRGGSGNFGEVANTPPENGIQALTADDTHLYWVEYGTRDGLANYENDGALLAYSFETGSTSAIVSGLPGPTALAVSSEHAYVGVDGGALVGTATHPQLLRFPLAGGTPFVVQEGGSINVLFSSGDTAYWNDSSQWLTASADGTATTLLTSGDSWSGAADGTHLYFVNGQSIERAPLSGDDPQVVAVPDYGTTLQGEFIYGLEPIVGGGVVLDMVTKSGGTWQRKRGVGAGYPILLSIAGDRYFFTSHSMTGSDVVNITTGLLSTSDPPVRFVASRARNRQHRNRQEVFFASTADALYWSDGLAIYKRLLSDLP